MSLLEILFIAIGLAMDACAVSIVAGATLPAVTPRPAFRLSFHFGLFQFLMPVLGWFAGSRISHLVAAVDHWVACGLLAIIGVRMIRSGWRADTSAPVGDPSRGWALVLLSVATSIDAFAIGLSLAMLRVNIWYPSAVVTAGLSLAGLQIGRRRGNRFGRRMEIVGGCILLLIGLRILIVHLAG